MKNPIVDISQRKAAILAGFGFLIRLIVGPLIFFLLDSLFGDSEFIVPGEAAIAAAKNIGANEWLFKIFIACILIMVIGDVTIAFGLYILLKPVNKNLAMIAVFFRLTGAIVFATSMVFVFIAPILFTQVFLTGQFFTALHMLVIGYLVIKSDDTPKIFGALLIIGGAMGYLVEDVTYFLFPNYLWISSFGTMVAVIAEISFCLWLLLKCEKIPKLNNSEE